MRVRYATAGVGTTPALVTRRALARRAVRELGLDPGAGLARVAADQQARRLGAVRQRPHERGAEPPDRRRDRADSRRPSRARRRFRTGAVRAMSVFDTGDSHLHGRGLDARDAGVVRRVDVHGRA